MNITITPTNRWGQILVNGQVLDMGETGEMKKIALAGLAENPVELGENEYFLLGDNRDSSEDSRFSNVGNVRLDQIIGKVWFRIHPAMEFGSVQ